MASLLAACEPGGDANTVTRANDDPSSLLFEPPAPILAARAIVVENLELDIRAGDRIVAASRQGDGRWSGILTLPENVPVDVTLTWSEQIEGRPLLLLARAIEREFVPSFDGGTELFIPADRFRSTSDADPDDADPAFDFDRDGASNLAERTADTDPFDRDSSPDIVRVTLAASFALPTALADAGDGIVADVDVRATVNERPLALTREGNVWRGSSGAVLNEPAFIEVTFFPSADPTLALARTERSVDVTRDNLSVAFGAGDYTLPNSDGDDLNNIEELIGGSNPRDSSDPARAPCDVSQFEPGCDIDTDDDGLADSQETARADRDGDGIPDYRESRLEDADEDGRRDDDDAEDGDPCVPSRDNDACRAIDSDGDGVKNPVDNCVTIANPGQEDNDDDGVGDACDSGTDTGTTGGDTGTTGGDTGTTTGGDTGTTGGDTGTTGGDTGATTGGDTGTTGGDTGTTTGGDTGTTGGDAGTTTGSDTGTTGGDTGTTTGSDTGTAGGDTGTTTGGGAGTGGSGAGTGGGSTGATTGGDTGTTGGDTGTTTGTTGSDTGTTGGAETGGTGVENDTGVGTGGAETGGTGAEDDTGTGTGGAETGGTGAEDDTGTGTGGAEAGGTGAEDDTGTGTGGAETGGTGATGDTTGGGGETGGTETGGATDADPADPGGGARAPIS